MGRPFPTMRLARRAGSIDDYRIEDFEVEGHEPRIEIRTEVAVQLRTEPPRRDRPRPVPRIPVARCITIRYG